MIKHEIGDMFASDANVFAHHVNCKGVMGSGVAKQVRTEEVFLVADDTASPQQL